MRLKENLLSKKEWENKRKFLAINLEQIPEMEKEFQEKLGLNNYFKQKTTRLFESMAETPGQVYGLDQSLSTNMMPTAFGGVPNIRLNAGSLTERNQMPEKLPRPKSQSALLFKSPEDKKHYEEFMQKFKEDEKKRRKAHKQMLKAQQAKSKEREEMKEKLEKQKKEETEKEKKLRFLQVQESLAKKERERIEQKQEQDEMIKKLKKNQPMHVRMEEKYN